MPTHTGCYHGKSDATSGQGAAPAARALDERLKNVLAIGQFNPRPAVFDRQPPGVLILTAASDHFAGFRRLLDRVGHQFTHCQLQAVDMAEDADIPRLVGNLELTGSGGEAVAH